MITMLRRTSAVGLFALLLAGCDDDPSGPEPVASVAIAPSAPTLIAGSSQTLTVVAVDEDGVVLTGRPAAWSSASPEIVRVTDAGVVTGVTVGGPVAVTATVEGKSAVALVTVVPVPIATLEIAPNPVQVGVSLSTQLTIIARDSAGGVLTGRPVTLFSANPAIATVTGTGSVTGVMAGSTIVSATSGGKTATATVNVVPGPVRTLEITPRAPEIRVGATLQLTATTRDASGAVVTGRTVSWVSSDPSKVTVSPAGVITGIAEGGATVTASSEGSTGQVVVTVLAARATGITFDLVSVPNPLIVGDTARLRALVRDSLGRTLTDRPITFSGNADGVATVSPDGRVSAMGPGVVVVTATSGDISATLSVTVADVYASFGRSGFPCMSVQVGSTCTATASLRFFQPDNAVQGSGSGAYRIDITSSDPTILSVNQTTPNQAVLTGIRTGSVTLTATYRGANGIVTRSNSVPVNVYP